MFSGIVETKQVLSEVLVRDEVIEIRLPRPRLFSDIKIGDSIAVNGVCLTVEAFDSNWMQFALGKETLKVTGWNEEKLKNLEVNLERSLRLGERIHGSMMSGHVDTNAKVLAIESKGENLILQIELPKSLKVYCWEKASICVNGISLTVNEVKENYFTLGIIPETKRITNVTSLKVGDQVNLEADYFAKAMYHFWEQQNA